MEGSSRRWFTIRPGIAADFESHGLSLGAGERAYVFRIFRFGMPEEYELVVGRLGRRRVMRAIRPRLEASGRFVFDPRELY